MENLGLLGQGAYGYVYLTEYKGKKLALKRNTVLADINFHYMLRELDMLNKLKSHPLVITLEGLSFVSPFGQPLPPLEEADLRDDQLYFLLEYAESDLYSLIYDTNMSVKTFISIVMELLTFLEYIHAKGIIHRDIKPANILYRATATPGEGSLRICDFGLSKQCYASSPLTPRVITSWYRAPEVYEDKYSLPADIWSAGCVLVECLTRRALFKGATEEIVKQKLALFTQPERQIPIFIGFKEKDITAFGKEDYSQLLDLLSGLLQSDPQKRLTAAQALETPFCRRHLSLVEKIRKEHPPLPDPDLLMTIHQSPEREKAFTLAQDIFTKAHLEKSTDFLWYNHQILFTSLMLFDRYLGYLHQQQTIQPGQSYHSSRGTALRYFVCLYMALKYFATLAIPEPFIGFLAPYYEDELVPGRNQESAQRTWEFAHSFERLLIQEVCLYRIYLPTPFDYAGPNITQEETRSLLYFYKAMGGCQTTSRKIYASWLEWLEK